MRLIFVHELELLAMASPFMALSQVVPAEHADQARVDRLLGQMTLEEKVNLIRGGVEPAGVYQGHAGYLLGVPSLRLADGPPGLLTRVPAQAKTAAMGVAATWSRRTTEHNGLVIGREARSLGIDVVLQPFINIDRDITFSRSYKPLAKIRFCPGPLRVSLRRMAVL